MRNNGFESIPEKPKGGPEEINVLALVKGEERYVFMFKDEFKAEVLRVLGRFASSPDLSFTWYDAAVLSQRVRVDPRPKQERLENGWHLKPPSDDEPSAKPSTPIAIPWDDFVPKTPTLPPRPNPGR